MVVRQWELRRGADASWRSRRGQELPDPGRSPAPVHPRRVGGFYVRRPGRRVRPRSDGLTVTAGRDGYPSAVLTRERKTAWSSALVTFRRSNSVSSLTSAYRSPESSWKCRNARELREK